MLAPSLIDEINPDSAVFVTGERADTDFCAAVTLEKVAMIGSGVSELYRAETVAAGLSPLSKFAALTLTV